MSRPGPILLIAAVATAFMPGRIAPAAAVLLALFGGLAMDRSIVRAAFRGGAVLALFLAAAATGAAVAFSTDVAHGLTAGATLLARLLVLGIAMGILARRTDAERILPLARRLGLERAGLVVGLSLNVLPHLVETVRDTWTALVIRTGGRWPGLRRLAPLPEVLLAHTARLAEAAAAAAAPRGHTALAPRPHRPTTLPRAAASPATGRLARKAPVATHRAGDGRRVGIDVVFVRVELVAVGGTPRPRDAHAVTETRSGSFDVCFPQVRFDTCQLDTLALDRRVARFE